MKRFLIVFAGIVLGILFLGISAFLWYYNTYSPEDGSVEAKVENVAYFRDTYSDCRNGFRKLSEDLFLRYPEMQLGDFVVESRADSDLTVDWFYIPARKETNKLIIMTSGLHGIEGFAGSAIQQMFMGQLFRDRILDDTGLFFVHGLNPYGFKYLRKVTENNVDLNRNCLPGFPANITNKGFVELQSLLIPQKILNVKNIGGKLFPLKVVSKVISHGISGIRESTLKGQYAFGNGFYYGGKEWEPQIKQVEALFKKVIPEYNIVVNIDLHTGYGERGQMHVFLNPIDDMEVKSAIEFLFSHEKIDWGGDKGFYTTTGDYLSWGNGLFRNSLYLPVLLEFGTYNSQEIMGSIKSLQIMINENQGYHHGYKNAASKTFTHNEFKELYYPSSDQWKSAVIDRARQSLKIMMDKLEKFESGK